MENNEKLLSAIFSVDRLIKEELRTGKCLVDFSQAEMEVLKFLYGRKNTTMKAIADYLHIKPSSATPLIDNLVKKDNLKRISKKGDRRVVYIELTQKGAKCLRKKYKNMHKIIRKVFSGLNRKDKKIITKIFGKIHNENN